VAERKSEGLTRPLNNAKENKRIEKKEKETRFYAMETEKGGPCPTHVRSGYPGRERKKRGGKGTEFASLISQLGSEDME